MLFTHFSRRDHNARGWDWNKASRMSHDWDEVLRTHLSGLALCCPRNQQFLRKDSLGKLLGFWLLKIVGKWRWALRLALNLAQLYLATQPLARCSPSVLLLLSSKLNCCLFCYSGIPLCDKLNSHSDNLVEPDFYGKTMIYYRDIWRQFRIAQAE